MYGLWHRLLNMGVWCWIDLLFRNCFNYTEVCSLHVSGMTWQVQAKCRYFHEHMQHKTVLGCHRKRYAVSRNKNLLKMFVLNVCSNNYYHDGNDL